jgi:hypothetical protein
VVPSVRDGVAVGDSAAGPDGSVRGGGTPGALVLVAEDGRGPVPVDETVGGRRWPEGDHVGGAVG